MKHKTLFRLMLKVIGVWVFVTGASSLLTMLAGLAFLLVSLPGGMTQNEYYSSVSLVGPLLQTAAGLYLFFGGRWIADRAIPSNRPYCHECGYELTGANAASDLCPECGTPFRAPAIPTPTARG